jgi:hypothetical protein
MAAIPDMPVEQLSMTVAFLPPRFQVHVTAAAPPVTWMATCASVPGRRVFTKRFPREYHGASRFARHKRLLVNRVSYWAEGRHVVADLVDAALRARQQWVRQSGGYKEANRGDDVSDGAVNHRETEQYWRRA